MKLRAGTRLLGIRQDKRLSQAEFADLLGVNPSTYARIERNETSVEFEKLAGFADALDVPIFELLPETLQMNNNTSDQGSVVFGTNSNTHNSTNYIHNYYGEDVNDKLAQRNEYLEKQVADMNEKIARLEKLIEGISK